MEPASHTVIIKGLVAKYLNRNFNNEGQGWYGRYGPVRSSS